MQGWLFQTVQGLHQVWMGLQAASRAAGKQGSVGGGWHLPSVSVSCPGLVSAIRREQTEERC